MTVVETFVTLCTQFSLYCTEGCVPKTDIANKCFKKSGELQTLGNERGGLCGSVLEKL